LIGDVQEEGQEPELVLSPERLAKVGGAGRDAGETRRFDLTDGQWAVLQPLLPAP
jgi:hypothetical protein